MFLRELNVIINSLLQVVNAKFLIIFNHYTDPEMFTNLDSLSLV